MHSGVYEPIWLKCGMTMDTIGFYSFILVSVSLTFIQGLRNARKQNLANNFTKFLIDYVEFCILLRRVGLTNFTLLRLLLKGENFTYMITSERTNK